MSYNLAQTLTFSKFTVLKNFESQTHQITRIFLCFKFEFRGLYPLSWIKAGSTKITVNKGSRKPAMLIYLSFLKLGAELDVKHQPGLGPSVSISFHH